MSAWRLTFGADWLPLPFCSLGLVDTIPCPIRHLSHLEKKKRLLNSRREHVLSPRARKTLKNSEELEAGDQLHDSPVIDSKLADSLRLEMAKFKFIKMIVSVPSSDGEVTSEMNESLLQNWYDEVFSAGLGMPSAEKAHVAAIRALGDLQSYYVQDWDPAWAPVTRRETPKSFLSRISALKERWQKAATATESHERSTNTSGSFQSNKGSHLTSGALSSTMSQAGTGTEDSHATEFGHSLLLVSSLPTLRRMRSGEVTAGSVMKGVIRKTKSFYTGSNVDST